MIAAHPSATDLTTNRQTWDAQLDTLGGHFLQSWRWGEFKKRSGWEVDRVALRDGSAMAQILYRTRGPVSVAYVPRGPSWSDAGTGLPELIEMIEQAAKRRRAIFAILEQEKPLPAGMPYLAKWTVGPEFVQPGRTVKIPLVDDESMLMGMHQKTRYSVRLAMRKGVIIEKFEESCADGMAAFTSLLEETSKRNEFGIHPPSYYRDFMDVFGDDSAILLAKVHDQPAAGLIVASFGTEAIYMYGGSSSEHRSVGAAFLLQFEAMRWARERGMSTYDLWGIPHKDLGPETGSLDHVPATRGDDWRGLVRFKTGFGGSIVDYPPPLERQFSRIGTRVVRQYLSAIG